MVDYMIWPWFEREGILQLSGNNKLKVFDNSLPQLVCNKNKTEK
jgi:hypothetical protein